jgi:hypothetical protein
MWLAGRQRNGSQFKTLTICNAKWALEDKMVQRPANDNLTNMAIPSRTATLEIAQDRADPNRRVLFSVS